MASAVPATAGLPIQALKGCVALTPSTYPLPERRSGTAFPNPNEGCVVTLTASNPPTLGL